MVHDQLIGVSDDPRGERVRGNDRMHGSDVSLFELSGNVHDGALRTN
jgi:hypothetical protein